METWKLAFKFGSVISNLMVAIDDGSIVHLSLFLIHNQALICASERRDPSFRNVALKLVVAGALGRA